MDSANIYAARAAQRLRKILDEAGYPQALLERARGLSRATKLSEQEATHLLSGVVPWCWSHIHAVCMAFSKSPGYLFDEDVQSSIPSKAMVVTSAEGGESTVWCPPAGLGCKGSPQSKLRYVVRAVGRDGKDKVALFIFCEGFVFLKDLAEGDLFVMGGDAEREIACFEHVTQGSAIFKGTSEPTIYRRSIATEESGAIEGVLGAVVGVVEIM